MSGLRIFVPICKVDEKKRLVYGRLSEEITDKSGEILDYESSKPAFQKWSDEQFEASGGKSKGNLREMHESIAAGKFTDITFNDETKSIEGVAKVVDDASWDKVLQGVLTGFSIGGRYTNTWPDPNNPNLKRYTPELAEVSLVDNPCVPTATFQFIKEDGSTELRKFNTHEVSMTEEQTAKQAATTEIKDVAANTAPASELVKAEDAAERPQDKGGVVQGFMAKDGTFHLKKADALKRNIEVDAESLAAPAIEAVKNLTEAIAKADVKDDKKPEDAKEKEDEEDKTEGKEGDDKESDAKDEPKDKKKKKAKSKKSASAEGVKKGMYAVARLADLLQSLDYLHECCEREEDHEGDDSTVPAKLEAALSALGDILKQMTQEEVDELLSGEDDDDMPCMFMSAKSGDLSKRGAALSAATKGHIDKMYKSASDHMDEMGKCYKALGMGDADKNDDDKAEKNTSVVLENNALKKVLGDLAPQIEALTKRVEAQQAEIKKLADQPLAPKGALRAVEKATDGGNVSDGDAVTKAQDLLKGMSTEEVNMVLMKTALSKPMIKN